MGIRKVYVYKKTRTKMEKLKAGDIFSMDPFCKEDKYVDSKELLLLGKKKPTRQKNMPKGFYQCFAVSITKILERPQ